MLKIVITTILASLALSGCTPESDMQGVDPREFYAAHPIKNTVKSQGESYVIMFEPGASKPSKLEVTRFRDAISDRSLLSLESVEIQLSPADMRSTPRKEALVKMLKYLGYRGGNIQYRSSDAVVLNQALLVMTFSVVVAPDCPDWRQSPEHNFSNHDSANFGCATEVNLGLMVADPRDLAHGTGELPPAHSQRGDLAITQYHTGGAKAAAASPAPAAGAAPAEAAPVAATPAPQ